jgi:hypothetical protein
MKKFLSVVLLCVFLSKPALAMNEMLRETKIMFICKTMNALGLTTIPLDKNYADLPNKAYRNRYLLRMVPVSDETITNDFRETCDFLREACVRFREEEIGKMLMCLFREADKIIGYEFDTKRSSDLRHDIAAKLVAESQDDYDQIHLNGVFVDE